MDSNTRTIININTWDRKESYEFYKTFVNPQLTITADVDCTEAYNSSKADGTSFFRKYLYAILRSVNEITELRYRIELIEGEEAVVQYKKISVITPIKINNKGEFISILVPYHLTFEKFNKVFQDTVNKIGKTTSDPYLIQKKINEHGGFMDSINVSALTDLNFSSMTAPQSCSYGPKRPLICVGKAVQKEGKLMMPISITFHHGLCDGHHISKFYNLVNSYLKEL